MSEEYDPFAEEVDFDELPEDQQQEQEHTVIAVLEGEKGEEGKEYGSVPSKRCVHMTGNKSAGESEGDRLISNKKIKRTPLSDAITEETTTTASFLIKRQPQIPQTEEEKWLWKSGWQYVRKFLKPFLQKGLVSCDHDLDRLSKKLAQKVYEKELAKGTLEMTSQNAKVIKKYVHAFFDRHGSYDGSSSTH